MSWLQTVVAINADKSVDVGTPEKVQDRAIAVWAKDYPPGNVNPHTWTTVIHTERIFMMVYLPRMGGVKLWVCVNER